MSTPHYPGLHNLWSRDWTTDDQESPPPLGEIAGTRRWDNGIAPRPRPLPILVGNADCVRYGETGPDDELESVQDNTCNSYPAACYGPDQPQVAAYDITCCETQKAFALTLTAQYLSTPIAVNYLLEFLSGNFFADAVNNDDSLYPGSIVCIGKVAVIVISGTTHFQQAAFYSLYAATGPIDFGAYSTNAVWQLGALTMQRRMIAAGLTSQTEIYIVGHSYGGAISCVLAARMALTNPALKINLLTFAAPAPGDERLINILKGVRQLHMVNPNDPVPALPPRGLNLLGFLWFISGGLAAQWGLIFPQENRVLLAPNGQQTDSGDEYLELGLEYQVAQIIASLDTMPRFVEHFMSTYSDRMQQACYGELPPYVFPDPLRITLANWQLTYQGITYNIDATCCVTMKGQVTAFTTARHPTRCRLRNVRRP